MNEWIDRRHLLLTAEGWVYLLLSVFELLTHVLDSAQSNVDAFAGFDVTVGAFRSVFPSQLVLASHDTRRRILPPPFLLLFLSICVLGHRTPPQCCLSTEETRKSGQPPPSHPHPGDCGLQRSPINFPPTFKYDVLRTLKPSSRSVVDNEDEDDPRRRSHVNIVYVQPPFRLGPLISIRPITLSLSHVVSAQKAKTSRKTAGTTGTAENGYFNLPAVPPSPAHTAFPPTPKMIDHAVVVPPTPPATKLVDSSPLVPPPKVRVESVISGVTTASQDNLDVEKGVYDTSNKKRVPSW
ncbi:hypothetical protein NMY22_g20282 [Coprinellus aureogranulatus]|nr:hypothetical protein NMY22_g20282 [Coprinellus aureogranulatus]